MVGRRRRFTGGRFFPNHLPNLELWPRFNIGIIVVGAGVDTWADQSGNGRDLRQTVDTNRPSKESDGSILFDGVDNYLKANSFTLVQPETVYGLLSPITWSSNDRIWDGEAAESGAVYQAGSTPEVRGASGATPSPGNTDFILDTYAVLISQFNGTSSLTQVNKNAALVQDMGTSDMSGFHLGVRPGAASGWGNIQVKEIIIYSAAHDAATRTQVIDYLSDVGGLGL